MTGHDLVSPVMNPRIDQEKEIEMTPDDLMRLIERYAAHMAVAEMHDAADAHRARDRELSKADDFRGRLRTEVDGLAVALRQRDQLFSTLADVLGNFHEKGHPGRPCIRTGWVREETYERWHGVLAGIVASDGPSRD